MYYDLIAGLPHLPYFAKADRLPITPLQLKRRLNRLDPQHADQIRQVRSIARWRGERLGFRFDRSLIELYRDLQSVPLDSPLDEFVVFRMRQHLLVAALRCRAAGIGMDEATRDWGHGPELHLYAIRHRWDEADFGLRYVHRWLPAAAERLSDGNAVEFERLLMDLNWKWLSAQADRAMFGFGAVVAFVFKWDMLQAWLENDPRRAEARFTELIDKVTDVANT